MEELKYPFGIEIKKAKSYRGILCPKCKLDRFGILFSFNGGKWMCYKCLEEYEGVKI